MVQTGQGMAPRGSNDQLGDKSRRNQALAEGARMTARAQATGLGRQGHLAGRISSLLQHALSCLSFGSFLYRELLNTVSRNRPSRNSELPRAAIGLVKVLCKLSNSAADSKGKDESQLLKQGSAFRRI